MGISFGYKLISAHIGEIAIVIVPKLVRFREEEISLINATQLILNLEFKVCPGSNRFVEGRLLKEVFNETYERGV
ncbi:MAG: hypothetical protein Q8K70_00920 [Bacteroidota bacterium]|nr:hypothetical protein [Bacteroidota bacterium]